MAEEKQRSYGPYELVPGVNSLSFGSDPVLTLVAGKAFSTKEKQVAAFLAESPYLVQAKAKPRRKARRPQAASSAPSEGALRSGAEA